ncbi:AcrR family transcriptional regulator [Paenochrobactrum gallinarii]|uniref:AcrR family transcriptional regulator n=1 Tax=Paenochrobactrum gallinarii TaxID=643673 RepID=A0A841LTH2_9HYPH|nr:TetR/AcrR family transcriptional regulator [Paenochrobactrum gallinarii]MBB6259787.1 AcrR family transcriptional regulator [Paenochrobactrum gallinarii]
MSAENTHHNPLQDEAAADVRAEFPQGLSPRQNDVLEQALRLLVEGGDRALTTSGIARAANCSKESLYKWFGDRDGLLTEMVRWQASKVRVVPVAREKLDAEALFSTLEHFARDWLLVLSGETSIALNRLAVSHAGSGKSALGRIVVANGPAAMAARLNPVLTMGQEAGLLAFDDIEEAFRTFFGLVVRDMQIRLLLGDERKLGDAEVIRDARRATRQFFALYGA